MKLQAILILTVIAGLGIALGDYLTPKVFTIVPVETPGAASEGSLNSDAASNDNSGTKPKPAFDSGELSSILQENGSFGQTKKLLAYVDSLTPAEIPDALAQMAESRGVDRDQALALLIGRWVEIDPKGAQTGISKIEDRKVKDMLIRDLYAELSAEDSSSAISQARQLSNKEECEEAVAGIIQELAQHDPAQALELYQEMKSDSPDAKNQIETIFRQWTRKDPAQATQTALQLSNSPQRTSAVHAIMNELLDKDPLTAAAWLDQLPRGQMQTDMRSGLVYAWALKDPPAAAHYITSLPPLSRGRIDLPYMWNPLFQSVTQCWVMADPQAGMAWVESLPPQLRKPMRNLGLEDWAVLDPQAAVDYVSDLPQTASEKKSSIQCVIGTWAENNPQGALAWINQLPDGKDKDDFLVNTASQWAIFDSTGAAAYVESMPDVPARQKAMPEVARSLARNDPVATLQWLSKFPDGKEKNDAYGSIAEAWAQNDPDQAANWLAQLPPGPARDTAAWTFCVVVGMSGPGRDPARAYQMAETISDPKKRQDTVTSELQLWMGEDPIGAAAAVQKSSLPDDVKASLLQTKQ